KLVLNSCSSASTHSRLQRLIAIELLIRSQGRCKALAGADLILVILPLANREFQKRLLVVGQSLPSVPFGARVTFLLRRHLSVLNRLRAFELWSLDSQVRQLLPDLLG